MIKRIYIKNFAIIEETNIEFKSGLNIITGQTGAGKTLIVKAIQCLLGKRFSSEMLGPFGDRLIIEGEFNHGSQCLIRRMYDSSGKSRSFINDEPVTRKKIITKSHEIIDLHGQHEHQNLLDKKLHIDYLDLFTEDKALLDRIKSRFIKMEELKVKIEKLKIEKNKNHEMEKLHEFQLNELSQIPLSPDYEKEIMKKHEYINNLVDINEHVDVAMMNIENDSDSILKKLNTVAMQLEFISKYESNFSEYNNIISGNIIEIQDLYDKLNDFSTKLLIDSDEVLDINSKVEYLQMLKRKYGGTTESVLEYYDTLKKNNDFNKTSSSIISKLEQELDLLKNQYIDCAKKLSSIRKKNSKILEDCINENLKTLEMSNASFKIKLSSENHNISINGIDDCEFYISTNSGCELEPLSKIVSGGEVSRIMLAIKISLNEKDLVPSLLFDEIDTGISGIIAEKVGRIIEKLSLNQQIICISHLSQIASKGSHHFNVSKHEDNGSIKVEIKKLNQKERINEIASLISGEDISRAGYEQAEILLNNG